MVKSLWLKFKYKCCSCMNCNNHANSAAMTYVNLCPDRIIKIKIRLNIFFFIKFQLRIMLKRSYEFTTRQIWGIWKLRLAYSPETPNLGQNRWCFVPCDLETWRMTLENDRASLLCCFKLCATFHSHWWIQTGVTVRKRPFWVKLDDF